MTLSLSPRSCPKRPRSKPLATITEWLGHRFLKVGGITMCREGDVNRDATILGSYWDLTAMRQAQRRINKAARTQS